MQLPSSSLSFNGLSLIAEVEGIYLQQLLLYVSVKVLYVLPVVKFF